MSKALEAIRNNRGSSNTSSSSASKTNAVGVSRARRKYGNFDNFYEEINSANTALNSALSGWQDADTMHSTKRQTKDMLGKMNAYKSATGSSDFDELISGYSSAIDNWDSLSETYSYYQNADAFNTAMEEYKEKNKTVSERYALRQNADFNELSDSSDVYDDQYELNLILGRTTEEKPLSIEVSKRKLGSKVAQLSDEQMADATYLYKTKGADAFEKYVNEAYDEVIAGYQKKKEDDYAKWSYEHPFISGALNVPFGLVTNFVAGAWSIGDFIGDGKIETNKGPVGLKNVIEAGSSAGIQRIKDDNPDAEILGFNIPGIFYEAATSGLASRAGQMVFGMPYNVLMGSSSFLTSYSEAKENGMSESQALWKGIMSGSIEFLTEQIGMEGALGTEGKNLLTRMAKQAVAEGLEEVVGDIAFNTLDLITMGTDSDVYREYSELLSRGYSTDEAAGMVVKNTLHDTMEAFFSAALSVGPTAAVAEIRNTRTGNRVDISSYESAMRNIDRVGSAEQGRGQAKNIKENQNAYERYLAEYEAYSGDISLMSKNNLGNLVNSTMTGDAARLYNTSISDKANANFEKEIQRRVEEKKARKISKARIFAEAAKGKMAENAKKMAEKLNIGEESVTATGEKIDLSTSTVSVDGGDVYITTQSGDKINANDATLTIEDAEYISRATDMAIEEQKSYFESANGNSEYTKTFDIIWAMGRQHMGLDDTYAVLEDTAGLSNETIALIYKQAEAFQNSEAANNQAEHSEFLKTWNKQFKAGNFDTSGIKDKKLSSQKKNLLMVAEAFTSLGINIKVVDDESAASANGMFSEEDNVVTINLAARRRKSRESYGNGSYVVSTLAHEFTHWMEEKMGAEFELYKNLIREGMGEKAWNDQIDSEQVMFEAKHKGKHMDRKAAESEVVARASENMLKDTELFDKYFGNADADVLARIRDAFKKFFDEVSKFFKNFMEKYDESHSEASVLIKQNEEAYKKACQMWLDMFDRAIKLNQEREANLKAEAKDIENQDKLNNIVGEHVTQFNDKTWDNGGKDFLVNWLNTQDLSDEDKNDIIDSIDEIRDIMARIKPQFVNYSAWSDVDSVEENLDAALEKGINIDRAVIEKYLSVVVNNGEYPFNIDFATVCKKRRALNSVLNKLVKEGVFSNYMPSEQCVTEIIDMIKKHDFEVACALCFVDSKRYKVGSWAKNFTQGMDKEKSGSKEATHTYGWNELVKSMAVGNYNVDEYNFTGRNIKNPTKNLVRNSSVEELEKAGAFKLIDKVIAEEIASAGDGKTPSTRSYQLAVALREKPYLASLLHPSEIISSVGLDAMKVQNNELYAMVNASGGSSAPKLAHEALAYNNDILRKIATHNVTADDLYKIGGFRVQSFSDYMANMVFDYVQMFGELAANKFPAHAYTKEYYFVKLFGMTGIKINMSIVPDAVRVSSELQEMFDAVTYKLLKVKSDGTVDSRNVKSLLKEAREYEANPDRKGNAKKWEKTVTFTNRDGKEVTRTITRSDIETFVYYMDHAGLAECKKSEADYIDKDSNGKEHYWKYILVDETFPLDKAFEIQKDSRYNKNCGIIWVGVSKAHILSMLRDDRIPMVIPYHKSSINPLVAHLRGINMYNDFTLTQHERGVLTGRNLSDKNEAALYKKFKSEWNFYDDLKITHNPRQTAENYKAYCADNGIIPMFDEFKDEDGYYKLLFDFRMYGADENGNLTLEYAPQSAVTMTFPDDFETQVTYSLEEYEDTEDRFSREQQLLFDDVNKIVNKYKKSEGTETFYSDKLDNEYEAAVKSGDMTLAQKMVDAAAKAAGYTIRAFHGTNAEFNVFSYDKLGSKNFLASSAHMGFFAAKSRETAEAYTGLNSMDMMSLALNSEAQANMEAIKQKYNWESKHDEFEKEREKFFDEYKASHGYKEEVTDMVDTLLGNIGMLFKDDESNRDEKISEFVNEITSSLTYRWNEKHLNNMLDSWDETEYAKSYKDFEMKISEEWEQTELDRKGYVPNVKNLYLKMEKPFIYDFNGEGRDTESFAARMAKAKEEGYDGCIFLNVADGADIDDIYTVFSNTQLKSAEAVTYDDNGNLIPLSQRFNKENEDIRYSDKLDREYEAAVKEGDASKIRRLVGAAAIANGYYSPLLYHGTTGFGFTQIDVSKSDDGISFFATDSIETANTYSYNAGVREIKNDGAYQKNLEEAEAKYNDLCIDMPEAINRYMGIQSFVDLDEFRKRIDRIRRSYKFGLLSYDDVIDRIYEYYINDLWGEALIDVDSDDDEKFNTYIDEHEELTDMASDLAAAVKNCEDAQNSDNTNGNYQLYANTEGMLRIDAEGNHWNRIPLGELKDAYNEWYNEYYSYFLGTGDVKNYATTTTRYLAKYAYENGYTGVIVEYVVDDGGRGTKLENCATVYIFFNPKIQVKSADLTVYDDDGNLIPLSKRFDMYNDDIRYSDKLDSEGNKLNEGQVEYFAKSKIRDALGRLIKVYHGSSEYGFTIFDTLSTTEYGSHFGTKSAASKFDDSGKKTYEGYLNIEKPLRIPDIFGNVFKLSNYVNTIYGKKDQLIDGKLLNGTTREEIKIINNKHQLPYNDAFKKYTQAAQDLAYDDIGDEILVAELAQNYLKSCGYDGIIYENAFEDKGNDSYIIFDSEQFKRADNLNPTRDRDMRYSDKLSDIEEKAVKIFGLTNNFEEAGYILSDGKMLKFSNGKSKGRDYDHRAIAIAYGKDIDLNKNHGFDMYATPYLERFVEEGGIRIDTGSLDLNMDLGLQLSSRIPITRAQEQTIRELVEWKMDREDKYNPDEDESGFSLYQGPLSIHIDFGGDGNYAVGQVNKRDLDAWGKQSLHYEGSNINPYAVIADIRRYYNTGESSGQSTIARFHTASDDEILYSDKEDIIESDQIEGGIGIPINVSKQNFVEEIFRELNRKTIETREGRNVYKSLVGKRVGIVETGNGPAKLVGYVTIKRVKEYNDEKSFRWDEHAHHVKADSNYNFKSKKYGYVLSNPRKLKEPVILGEGSHINQTRKRVPLESSFSPDMFEGYVELKPGRLGLKDSRIDTLLSGSYYGASNPDYAQAYIAYMSPDDFLRLTTGFGRRAMNFVSKWGSGEWDVGDFDATKMGETYNDVPIQLKINEEVNEVYGHEGRHRMYQLQQQGVTSVPVLLFNRDNDYDKKRLNRIKLMPQHFDERDNFFDDSDRVVVRDLIPFSQGNADLIKRKFGEYSNPDTLFSDKLDDRDLLGQNARLEAENEKLKDDIKRLAKKLKLEKTITNGKAIDRNYVDKMARNIVKDSNSKISYKEVADDIEEIFNYIVNTDEEPEVIMNNVMDELYFLADKLADKNNQKGTFNKRAALIRRDIKGYKIKLSNAQKSAMIASRGFDYETEFKGSITFSDDGQSIDEVWDELSKKYPDIFKESIVKTKDTEKAAKKDSLGKAVKLAQIYDDLGDAMREVGRFENSEAIRAYAIDLYNKFWSIPLYTTMADKVKEANSRDAIVKLKAEHRKAIDEIKSKQKEALKNQSLYYRDMISKIRAEKNQKYDDLRKHHAEQLVTQRERAARKAAIDKIMGISKTLMTWLDKNTAKDHVPKVLREPVYYLLRAIDFSSKQSLGLVGGKKSGQDTAKDVSIKNAMKRILRLVGDVQDGMVSEKDASELNEFVDFPPGYKKDVEEIYDTVDKLSEIVGDQTMVLQEMSSTELEKLYNILKVMKCSVTQMNKLISKANAHSVDYYAQLTIANARSLGEKKANAFFNKVAEFSKGLPKPLEVAGTWIAEKGNKVVDNATKYITWSNTLPYYAFKHMGEGAFTMFENIMDGWDKFAFNIQTIKNYAKSNWTPEDYKRLTEDVHEFELVVVPTAAEEKKGGQPHVEKVKMTAAQMMSIYCLSKRDQAKSHFAGKGIRIETFKNGIEEVNQIRNVRISESALQQIIAELKAIPKAIEIADAIQSFMNDTCTKWGNAITMKRWGIEGFTEKNYFPIKVDKNSLATEPRDNESSIYRLLNLSFTKPLAKHATATMEISSIFDVFSSHTSDMAKYNALALPVLDILKWYNYKETDVNANETKLKAELESAFGKDAKEYIIHFLQDLNGTQEAGRNEKWSKKMVRSYKTAAVAANLQVALLQPISIIRAMVVMDKKYLMTGVNSTFGNLKNTLGKLEKYSGIYVWKDMSLFDTNVSRGLDSMIKQSDRKIDKAIEISMAGAEWGDKITWAAMWNACEAELKEKGTELTGEEFYKAVAKRFREIVYTTQVVDSTMTRTDMMRSQNLWVQTLTAFMSEPSVSINVLSNVFTNINQYAKRTGDMGLAIKKNGKALYRACEAYLLSAAVEAMIRAFIGGLRNYGDDDDDEDMVEKMWAEFLSNANPLNNVPIVKDVVTIFEGYNVKRMDMDAAQNAYYAMKGWAKVMDGNELTYKTVYRTALTLSQATGIPMSSALRVFKTSWNNTVGRFINDGAMIK